MLRFVRTHVRWGGIILEVAGLLIPNMTVFWVGVFIFALSYLWSHSIMEEMYLHIEDSANAEKKEDEDSNEHQS